MRLRIRYRSGNDEVSEREVSDIVVEPPDLIHAYCHLRGEERSFVLSRVEDARDAETGEVIPDVWRHFRLPSLKRPPIPPLTLPEFSCRRVELTPAQLRNQRSADKNALFRLFQYEVIIQAKRRHLSLLFSHRCFACRSTQQLELDHHVPQVLGGRLFPGNIVLLCAQCNSRKGMSHPSTFYGRAQLEELQAILLEEVTLFDFKFSWAKWSKDPANYLLSLDLSEAEVRSALHEPNHPTYIRGALG